ncbi:MAG: diadenylate cyclase [Kiritimatiellia bacterium]
MQWGIAYLFQLEELERVLAMLSKIIPLLLIVAFQPEIRRIFQEVGHNANTRKKKDDKPQVGASEQLIHSLKELSGQKIGSIIVLERKESLERYTTTGVRFSEPLPVMWEVIGSLFYPGAPVHDGGIIIRNSLIYYGGCVFPLAEGAQSRESFGTRHRAAIGLSENQDAVVLVTSEENGTVSIACNGELYRGLEEAEYAAIVRACLDQVFPETPIKNQRLQAFFRHIKETA